MVRDVLRVVSVLLTAVCLGAGLAHLFALPNKIDLAADDYLTVQQIYRGWALLGVAVLGALTATVILTFLVRRQRGEFLLTAIAALCIAVSLIVFFTFTFPANQATENWTFLPENWESLRRNWEYSHASSAALYFVALLTLVLALLGRRRADRR